MSRLTRKEFENLLPKQSGGSWFISWSESANKRISDAFEKDVLEGEEVAALRARLSELLVEKVALEVQLMEARENLRQRPHLEPLVADPFAIAPTDEKAVI